MRQFESVASLVANPIIEYAFEFPYCPEKVNKMPTQTKLDFYEGLRPAAKPFKTQLLKWVGNKQRFASKITSIFPAQIGRYFEPFLGSAAVLGTLSHKQSIGSDAFRPLVGIWQMLLEATDALSDWYRERCELIEETG